MKARRKHLAFATIAYAVVLCAFFLLDYLDCRGIAQIYLPMYLIALITMCWKKYWFGHIFLISAELGLILEYVIHAMQMGRPTMAGAFWNTLLIMAGLIVGIVIQMMMEKKQSDEKK